MKRAEWKAAEDTGHWLEDCAEIQIRELRGRCSRLRSLRSRRLVRGFFPSPTSALDADWVQEVEGIEVKPREAFAALASGQEMPCGCPESRLATLAETLPLQALASRDSTELASFQVFRKWGLETLRKIVPATRIGV